MASKTPKLTSTTPLYKTQPRIKEQKARNDKSSINDGKNLSTNKRKGKKWGYCVVKKERKNQSHRSSINPSFPMLLSIFSLANECQKKNHHFIIRKRPEKLGINQSTSTGPNSWTKKHRKKERKNCINKGKGKVNGKRMFPLSSSSWCPGSSAAFLHCSDDKGVVVIGI